MKLLRNSRCLVVLLASLACACASADPVSAEQLVKRLYATNSQQFDSARFAGKYDPERHCKLIRYFFAEPMIKHDHLDCILAGSSLGRFVAVDVANIPQTGDEIPKASVKPALAHDDVKTAVPALFSDDTRIVYFVKGTQGAARIVNMLISDEWPDHSDDEAGAHSHCPFRYALKANHFEAGVIPPGCRAHVSNAD
jgi:hypothetical protein